MDKAAQADRMYREWLDGQIKDAEYQIKKQEVRLETLQEAQGMYRAKQNLAGKVYG